MAPLVHEERNEDVAILIIDNPPVNALGADLRAELLNAATRLADDTTVAAIVLAARGRTFIAGADIREFGSATREPSLRDIILALECLRKPVVAAMDGAVLGGGLEVAMTCDVRLVTPQARLGMPEVKLGILPGSGGTQRLPRLVGPALALEMIATGEPLPAEHAVARGLADRLVASQHLLDEAIAEARGLALVGGRRRISEQTTDGAAREAFEAAAATVARNHPGDPQFDAIIDAVRASFGAFDSGLATERRHFETLKASDRARALRHIFLAERQASNLRSEAAAGELRAVGVIGGGTMGVGISMAFANAGVPVILIENDGLAAARAAERIADTYRQSVARGNLSETTAAERITRITPETSYSALARVDLVIEAAFEEMAVKREIFSALAKATGPTTILATNTSYLDVDEIARSSGVPTRVAGMHFFSPANVMKLVEVVRGHDSSATTVAMIADTARRLGKTPVIVGNCYGFVGNRMLTRRSEQVDRLLLEGALPEEIDGALVAFGFRMGPCAASDLAGLDISWRMRRATGRKAPVADALVEAGWIGQKAKRGYYSYNGGERRAAVDPEVTALIETVSAAMNIERRTIGQDEILDRMLLPMVNEGTRILQEKIAHQASDIDVVWVNGYGFPRWRGGPMHYAETRGFADVVHRLEHLAKVTGNTSLEPTSLLRQAAREGRLPSTPEEAHV